VSDLFGREKETEVLRQRLAKRKSFLLHGPAGVGKTALLSSLLAEFPHALYCAESNSKQGVFRTLALALLATGNAEAARRLKSAEAVKAKSAVAIKGLVLDVLRSGQFSVVLDHLSQPSAAFASDMREVTNWAATPVVGIARSPHMEDVGFLRPLFADRQEKMELKNFEEDTAASFARWAIARAGLVAGNLEDFLQRVLELSGGNPGAIIAMVAMARNPRYRSDDCIKITPLYVDFRLGASEETGRFRAP
jgi:hypothetical protein